jgi:hypothetical protein
LKFVLLVESLVCFCRIRFNSRYHISKWTGEYWFGLLRWKALIRTASYSNAEPKAALLVGVQTRYLHSFQNVCVLSLYEGKAKHIITACRWVES